MDFITKYKEGQKGKNAGITLNGGLEAISRSINGIQKKKMYAIAAAPKVGKTTFTDYAFLIQSYLYCTKNNIPIEWVYFSFEIDRVNKEFDFATHFLNHDYGINKIPIDGTVDGKDHITLSSAYLKGMIRDDNDKLISVNKQIQQALVEVYENRIVPIFGRYNEHGQQIKKGLITFVDKRENPTGIYKGLIEHAKRRGKFITQRNEFTQKNEIIGYEPANPNKYVIVITDHLRNLKRERGFTLKENVDKLLEYHVELRNLIGYTFVNIIHINRNMSSVERMKFSQSVLFPKAEDIKDTGNISEDSDYVFTMMDPNDIRYNLKDHFGLPLKDKGEIFYPNLRTIHLVESRDGNCPEHFRVNMLGQFKAFEKFKKR